MGQIRRRPISNLMGSAMAVKRRPFRTEEGKFKRHAIAKVNKGLPPAAVREIASDNLGHSIGLLD